jgi:hypothetical protein
MATNPYQQLVEKPIYQTTPVVGLTSPVKPTAPLTTTPPAGKEKAVINTDSVRNDFVANKAELLKTVQDMQARLGIISTEVNKKAKEEADAKIALQNKPVDTTASDLKTLGIEPVKTAEQIQVENQQKVVDNNQKEIDTANAKMDAWVVSNNETTASIIQNLRDSYQARKNQVNDMYMRQEKSYEQLGIRLGSRYSSNSFEGVLTAVENAKQNKISELDVEMNGLILQAQQASKASEKMSTLKTKQDEATKELQELQKISLKKNQEMEKEDQIIKRQSAIAGALNDGYSVADLMATGNFTTDDINGVFDSIVKEAQAKDKTIAGGDVSKLSQDAQLFYKLKNTPNGLPVSILALGSEQEQLNEFLRQMTVANTKMTASGSGSGSGAGGGGNTGFEQFTDEQIALSAIPTQLRNSDTELKRYLEGIRTGLNEGKTPYEIADNLMGYKIDKPDDFSNTIRGYMSIANLGTQEIGNVARLINKGDKQGAITVIENKVLDNQRKLDPESYVGEATPRYYSQKVSEIKQAVIDSGLSSVIGTPGGSFAQLTDKVPWTRRVEATKLKSKVASLVAEMRNHLSGTAVTESEKKFLEPLVASLSDKNGIFLNKLDEIKDNALLRYNTTRESGGLPKIDEKQLLNKGQRVGAYQYNSMDTAQTLGGSSPDDYLNTPSPNQSGYDPSIWSK